MAMTSSQVKREQQNNMAGSGTGWPRRNSQNSTTAVANSTFDAKFTPTPPAINRIINL